jgi:hypothetical protein
VVSSVPDASVGHDAAVAEPAAKSRRGVDEGLYLGAGDFLRRTSLIDRKFMRTKRRSRCG